MIVYMLKLAREKKYYKKGGYYPNWVDSENATVWQTRQGVSGALGRCKRFESGPFEIVVCELNPVKVIKEGEKLNV